MGCVYPILSTKKSGYLIIFESLSQKKWSVIILICIVLAVFSGYGSYALYEASTTTSSPSSTRTTPTPISGSPSCTPNTTGTPANRPSATVPSGLAVKNLTLTCSQCPSDPVHVTINNIQIDNANGRMIWDTTLRDITNSGRGFSFVKYDLEASGSTTPVSAVLSQAQFSGNQADMQAIFPFPPSPNVTYTGGGTIGTTRLYCYFVRHFRSCLTVLEKESICTCTFQHTPMTLEDTCSR